MTYLGEIRFGPSYYSLAVGNFKFDERIFGDSSLWSPDSRFFAIQEWETTDEGRGPRTHLLLVDLTAGRECVISRAEKGFIMPKKFEGHKIIYVKEFFAPRSTGEYEMELPSLTRWENLK